MLTILIRSLLLVGVAVLTFRLMGKRQVGQLQPFELVIAIMIADLAATPMESLDIPLWRGVAPMLALIFLHQLITLLSLKSQKLRAFFSGTPTVVIRRGEIDYKALRKLCFNLNDLMEELRTCGILSPTEVGTAIMETRGRLSVFPKSSCRPVCPEDLGLSTGYEGIPLTLVMDGQLEKHNLSLSGQKESWLLQHLAECGYDGWHNVLLCYLDTDGRLSVYGYEGKPPVRIAVLAEEEVIW
jgi:uncharacterized membrane protein YcaP (DUF421 family)